MKLKRISEKTQNEYKQKRTLAYTLFLVPAVAALTVILLAAFGIISGGAFILVYIAIGVLIFSLRYLVYLITSKKKWAQYVNNQLPEYVDIDEKGIHAEFAMDEKTINKLFSWDDLTEMKGMYLDLSISNNSKNKHKLANLSCCSGGKQDTAPRGITVEMYDEMLFEIKKHWKKESE